MPELEKEVSEAFASDRLVWLDLEMTGLCPRKNRIIEIATVVTDNALNFIAEGPHFAIFQEDSHLAEMDEWNTRQHGQSGLLERVRLSGMHEAEAEAQTLAFLEQHVACNASPLCGNSIGQDRRFLRQYMPKLADFFHYRNVDVSTFKELAKRWAPKVYRGFTKESRHLALDDVYDSIAELKYYRETWLQIAD